MSYALASPFAKVKRRVFNLIKDGPRDKDQDLIDEVDSAYAEAREFISGGVGIGMSLVEEWEVAGNHYLGNQWAQVRHQSLARGYVIHHGHESDEQPHKAVLNLTLNAILSNVEVQTSEPPTIRWQPVEIGEKPVYFLSEEGGKALKSIIDAARAEVEAELMADATAMEGLGDEDPEAESLLNAELAQKQAELEAVLAESVPIMLRDEQMVHPDDDTLGPAQPLSESEAGQINELIAQGLLQTSDLLVINDKACTEVQQQTWDHLYEQAGGEQVLVKNELLSNIYGNACIMLQWQSNGPNAHGFTLTNQHLLSVWIDPTHDTLEEAGYFGFDQCMHRDQAKSLYPFLDDEDLEMAAQTVEEARVMLPHLYNRATRRKGMVMIRTSWLRHKQVPMSIREAVAAGLVDETPVITNDRPAIDPGTGRARYRYTLAGAALKEGEYAGQIDVEPTDEVEHKTRWPDGFGVLQLIQLQGRRGRMLSKMRCPYADIPAGWNINIPRPDGSPFGMGEPKRLEHISIQINRALTILGQHIQRFQHSQMAMPSTLFKRLHAMGMDDIFRRPNGIIPIPDNVYSQIVARGGIKNMITDPPPVSPAMVSYLTTLIAQHDVLSGNAPVRQGRAPFAGAAAQTVRALQDAGEGPVALRAKWTEYMLERLGRIGMDAAVKWMPEAKWMQINSGWTVSAMREILRRLEKARFNVRASVVAGRGTAKAEKVAEAIMLYQNNLRSRLTTMALSGVENPERESELIQSEQSGAMVGAATPSPAAPAT